MSRSLFLAVCTVLAPLSAWAQRSPNTDMSALFGPSWVRAQPIPGSGVTLSGSHSWGIDGLSFGFRLKAVSVGALWLDIFPWASFSSSESKVIASSSTPAVTGSVRFGPTLFTSGVRYIIPLRSRLSAYGALGAGGGFFHYAAVNSAATPATVESRGTAHGTFYFGGGVEVLIVQAVGIRSEIRDYVTAAGLDGVVGRHHLAPRVGVAFHY